MSLYTYAGRDDSRDDPREFIPGMRAWEPGETRDLTADEESLIKHANGTLAPGFARAEPKPEPKKAEPKPEPKKAAPADAPAPADTAK